MNFLNIYMDVSLPVRRGDSEHTFPPNNSIQTSNTNQFIYFPITFPSLTSESHLVMVWLSHPLQLRVNNARHYPYGTDIGAWWMFWIGRGKVITWYV
jgi:hypothetical protein